MHNNSFFHVFFDLDKTLTKSRAPIASEHAPIFVALCKKSDVVVVTGGMAEHIREQLPKESEGMYAMLAQSGNEAVAKNGEVLWFEKFSDEQTKRSLAFIEKLKKYFNVKVRDENDLVELRGAQINYSVVGYHETPEVKYTFDPDFSKRKAALAQFPLEQAQLAEVDVLVVPAGSSGFNIIHASKNKGDNVARLLARENWKKEDCLYVGDALGPGENDETVIGVIPTHAVKDPDDTFRFIRENLLS
jgi:HAD superfamily hydrolase (TIGR01484 family)